ncbi:probable WRKY transcription factor protein 1 [Wyeomyia smithii]|uniref:probable WRKY transcription factor protein 1 n=1 Tax=Wyeomyia smithii TaxID=174621 RepID=UPI002467F623|nr:probable WRKY transcription factor protein 1 [Wyeomyia smithii]XP_055529307.1 probable WRKY transcription factor protein 1 [Wyeomyia smithii]XP_055529308.1 probable WRKY transcription factor protein 1 [Wyeomyia smithii]XP_055529309.1 probable WRKY transcription factor protein 1 [Wyeomyia smithii]XP_055529310.1 probable WRKY transcription factor protein 1 [Wyeomyia smithii]
MSAGLMSCVRENSPPLEGPTIGAGTYGTSGGGQIIGGSQHITCSSNQLLDPNDIPITITTPEHLQQGAGDTSTTRRKRFHPLRNLRRIFRRRTVSSADATPRQLLGKGQTHIHFATSGCSTTDATLPRTGLGVPITIRADSGGGGGGAVGAGFYKRETYRLRDADDLEKDMSDYQRSLSEGRLVDSDISRDGLSQSHDSVFSESGGTNSSLSITLKNELADVLRKRRKDRQHEASDEDLGLPQSPITPQRKDRAMNKSEGSLSILSMTSSDLDLEERSGSNASGYNLFHLDSSSSSACNRSSDNPDDNGAESPASKLSHSAAKHKLAVRPKKKGPTRARARTRESTVLPATPEVNEDSLKLSTVDIPAMDLSEAEEKCHSLTFGINPGALSTTQQMLSSSSSTTVIHKPAAKEPSSINSKLSASASLTTANSVSSSTIYVNRNISKSYDFNGHNGDGYITEELDLINGKKDDDGFFKRILNYSFKKKKHEHGLRDESSAMGPVPAPRKEDNTSTVYITPGIGQETVMKLSLPICETDVPEMSGYKKIKAGPAARQRVFPKDIFNSEVDGVRESPRYSSNVEVNRHSTSSNGSGSIIIGGEKKIIQHKSEEYLVSKVRKLSERSFDDEEDEEDGGRKYQPYVEKVKNSKIYNASPYQQRVAKISINQGEPPKESPTKRKPVEKSKSFRVYSDTVSNNLTNGNNLPSLPNLTNSLSVGNFSNNFLETEHKFFSMTENISLSNPRIFKDYITNVDELGEDSKLVTSNGSLQKFEINDNNLLNPREQDHHVDHLPKSIVLTTNTIATPEPSIMLHKSNQNISQIEETIDKLVSSPFVSIIKDAAGSNDRLDLLEQQPVASPGVPEFMKIQLNRVETARAKPNVVLSTSTPVSSCNTTPSPSPATPLNGGDESVKLRRFSNENIEITESKPPLPPSAVVTARSSLSEAPKSPPAFKRGELGSKRNSMNLSQEISDDRKVILQRRTSVTEEKIKYERRISSSSEDIKYERKKSGSDEVLEKNRSNYNSGSSSGDELVVLRKKSIVDNFKDKDKDTPELMKVFARRSLKLRSDEDYRHGDGKTLSSVDSDKENQSSEEKLDKLSKSDGAGVTAKGNGTVLTKDSVDGKTTPDSNSSDGLRKSTPKPFGVPNRFGNAVNVQARSAATFAEIRKSMLAASGTTTSATQNSNTNNINNNNNTKTTTDNNDVAGLNGTSINNNNNISNRHTIATMNQFNLNANNNNNNNINNNSSTISNNGNINGNNTTIETIGEVNEFKGILQRRAEWEKRAKEGFK